MLVTVAVALVVTSAAHAYSRSQSGVRTAICMTFRSYCSQALRVAQCESGFNVWARNGQYFGLFQMGTNERSTYGNGFDAWAQSRAAYRYFVATHMTWGPWQCKPW